uniref:Uncharacterized protein n=1 Tax=Rhizophora mucronata TaxID=61149 RepID=A0A2P2PMR0_RHIMU
MVKTFFFFFYKF